MHIQKITFTVLLVAAALAGNAQESKKKTEASAENAKVAPTQAVQETPQKGAPIPTSADTPKTESTPQTTPAQPMQAVPQTSTNGDKPVEDGTIKQPKEKPLKKNLKAKQSGGEMKK